MKTTTTDTLEKSAKLLCILSPEQGSQLLRQVPPDKLEPLMLRVARQGAISADERKNLVEDFYRELLDRRFTREGGFDTAVDLIHKSLPEKERVPAILKLKRQLHNRPFQRAARCDTRTLFAILREECTQVIAVVLAFLPTRKAADLLECFGPRQQKDITAAMCRIHQANREYIDTLEATVNEKLDNWSAGHAVDIGGIPKAAEILNHSEYGTSKGILENIEEDDVDLSAEIREALFTFNDCLLISDGDFQKVAREVDRMDMATALRGASVDLQEKFFANMSPRAADATREEMEFLGPVLKRDVEEAQKRVVEVIRRMEEQNEVYVDRTRSLVV